MGGFWVIVKEGQEEATKGHLERFFPRLEFKLTSNGSTSMIAVKGDDEDLVISVKSFLGSVTGVVS